MVHISDGVLPLAMLAAGFLFTLILLVFSMRNIRIEEIPKVSLITAALFVASLVHFPIGPTSVHLIMNGLAGILLGRRAFIGVFVALTLQAVFFQHGGLSVLGVNAFNIGVPALLAWQLFEKRRGLESPHLEAVFGALAGGLAVLASVLLVSQELLALGEAFNEISLLVIGAHLPVIIIEALVVGAAAGFLLKVKPEMLADSSSKIMEVN
jgi:cobalt/nickel transport system permease protein